MEENTERLGFEPREELLALQLISSELLSTAQPPLQIFKLLLVGKFVRQRFVAGSRQLFSAFLLKKLL